MSTVMAIDLELEHLYSEGMRDRKMYNTRKISLERLKQRDKQRLKRVKQLIGKFDESDIWNCHYACSLLIHSWGEQKNDYTLAHHYAKKAVDLGSNVTKWLFAASKDRMLVAQGKKQLYGTQFQQINGKWRLLPVDETITDAERAQYGVPPLKEAHKIFRKKYQRSGKK